MGYDNFNQNNNAQNKGLLASGWRPLNRDLDIGFFANIVVNDSWSLAKRSADFLSDVADALSRKQYAWWANILNVFSDSVQYEFNELWNYITPDPASPDRRHKYSRDLGQTRSDYTVLLGAIFLLSYRAIY